jgi:YbgC/YbaW family acyl-CoA thioester hydrolase
MSEPIPMQIAFDDADGEGIVFFGNYFRLAHRALEQYLPQIGIPWKIWFDNENWGIPLRKVECEYLSPLRPGQQFEAQIHVETLGDSSLTFGYTFFFEGKPVAKLKTVHVFIDRKLLSKIAIPEDLKKILKTQQV